jgi:transaldolase/glucose-6-phosphate isomerase
MKRMIFSLQEFQAQVRNRLSQWKMEDFMGRLRAKDPSLWAASTQKEITDRLGWLTLPSLMKERIEGIHLFREEIRDEGFSHAVLCGMGGSSLAPEVFQSTFGNAPGFPELIVADSTHPRAVESVTRAIDVDRTLFVVSSKSGTTLETLSLFKYFWNRIGSRRNNPGRQFVAITDPGTPLQTLGLKREFRKIFLAPTDVGGRFSALSEFGLVPSALIGLDIEKLLDRAAFAAENCTEDVTDERISCLYLGAALGEMSGYRDKMTVLASASLSRFPHWLEQLVAESTGKEARGIIPVIDEPKISAEKYGSDRFFVAFHLQGDTDVDLNAHLERIEKSGHPTIRIELKDGYGLAQEIFRWEVAVASAASILAINPFNQPDVELAKILTRQAMEEGGEFRRKDAGKETLRIEEAETGETFSSWISQGKEGDYFCIQAFLPSNLQTAEALQSLRKKLVEKTRLASTLGFGPRFLHSTGQLHKGGPDGGLFLQLMDEVDILIEVPETEFSFNDLIRAQAFGDYLALKERKRRVLRINLGENAERGIKTLAGLV